MNKLKKEDLIKKYKEIKDHLGHPPSRDIFCEEANISSSMLDKIFGSGAYSKLVKECGDIPNSFFTPRTELEDILTTYGRLSRKIEKLPAVADWKCYNCKPSIQGFTQTHNLKWSELPDKFREFATGKQEWKDIISLFPEKPLPTTPLTDRKIEELCYEYFRFIPPAVQDLIELSVDEEKSNEFEKKINQVFEMLGFEVTPYGQGTEDRKFIEYIKTHSESLRKNGFSNIYFLVVSSNFDTINEDAIKNITRETQVPISFLSAILLLQLLSYKIKSPRLFDLKHFQELLMENGEITEERINKFLKKTKLKVT